jgi:hypothetical protein
MKNSEIFEQVKGNLAGVKMIANNQIKIISKDGKEFITDQASFDSEYEIRFHCNGTSGCDDCSEHGSEKWEVFERVKK